MKKFILSIFVLSSFSIYVIWHNNINPEIAFTNQAIFSNKKNSYDLAINSINLSRIALNKISSIDLKTTSIPRTKNRTILHKRNSMMNNNMGMSSNMMGMYKNGNYIGSVVDAYYGLMQVKIVIIKGRLSKIIILDSPHNASTSRYINLRALPILKKEAIKAQSGEINAVSGASASSPAFIKTLISALNKAKA